MSVLAMFIFVIIVVFLKILFLFKRFISLRDTLITGSDGAVAKSSVNGLEGTGFASWDRLN